MRSFELMTTLGCHLCDDAAQLLVQGMVPARHEVDLVDIAYDDELMARYALKIPVLRDVASGRELAWPFDQAALAAFIATVECPEAG